MLSGEEVLPCDRRAAAKEIRPFFRAHSATSQLIHIHVNPFTTFSSGYFAERVFEARDPLNRMVKNIGE
jgi:hypothetical protein